MAESRIFAKVEGITVDGIGRSVQNFLHNSKGLIVQGGKAGQGYVVQAKEEGGWKKVSGMDTAVEVQISDTGGGFLVNIGNAKWADKVGAGVLAWFVFAPLAVTAVAGSVIQKKLPGEIFEHIERYITTGGRDLYLGADLLNAAAGMQICPRCKAEVPAGQAFCNSCGNSLSSSCPNCGESVQLGMAFCPKCGSSMTAEKKQKCPECGAPCPMDAAFCVKCGKKLPGSQVVPSPAGGVSLKCSKCGALNSPDDLFCEECGESLKPSDSEKSVCPSCGALFNKSKKFCSRCGSKI